MAGNKKQQILIVDDSLTIRMEISRLLESHGFEVEVAENGLRCLEYLAHKKPDIILLDSLMPELDGIETCQIIKADQLLKSIPVVFLTSEKDVAAKVKGLKAGAEDYLTKPFEEAELMVRIQTQLRTSGLLLQLKKEINERNQAQKELLQNKKKLKAAKEKAELASHAKSDFLANMSHEVRTPMNAIIGLTCLALQTELSARQKGYLGKIQDSAQSLLGIINDILDFSKIEAGKLTMESVDFNLSQILDQLTNMVLEKTEEKGLEFLFNIRPGTPFDLKGDPLRLAQVLTNLVNNAVKFTRSGEIVVSVEQINIDEREITLQFSVKDTGIGLNKNQIDKLFTAFFQADTSTTRRFGGTGLGLSICKRLVEMMKGKLWAESAPGFGSTFFFTAAFLRRKEPRNIIPLRLKGMRVLVVDDNLTSLEILETQLHSYGITVSTAGSGENALRKIESAELKRPFDLILMDWQMPGMDGIQASEIIKHDLGLKKIPKIILITAHAREEIIEQAGSANLDGFLLKPVNPSVLLNSILHVLDIQPDLQTDRVMGHNLQTDVVNSIAGARILLVEDNEINQLIAAELLGNAGFNITVVSNGRQAVDILENKKFEAVLMDIQMPEMDGIEATKVIRKQGFGKNRNLPIIAMTAHAMAGDREKSLEAGMNDHITKPIDPQKLFATLATWIKLAGYEPAQPC